MKLIPDLREFLELLNSENVQFVVIGGWAYNRYCEPRATGDIDIFVANSRENEQKLRRVLEAFGFGSVLPVPTQSLFQKKIIMLGRPPNRIDLLSEISGVSFDEAWAEIEPGFLDGVPLSFISKRLLIRNKTAAAREKDFLDLKRLKGIS